MYVGFKNLWRKQKTTDLAILNFFISYVGHVSLSRKQVFMIYPNHLRFRLKDFSQQLYRHPQQHFYSFFEKSLYKESRWREARSKRHLETVFFGSHLLTTTTDDDSLPKPYSPLLPRSITKAATATLLYSIIDILLLSLTKYLSPCSIC